MSHVGQADAHCLHQKALISFGLARAMLGVDLGYDLQHNFVYVREAAQERLTGTTRIPLHLFDTQGRLFSTHRVERKTLSSSELSKPSTAFTASQTIDRHVQHRPQTRG